MRKLIFIVLVFSFGCKKPTKESDNRQFDVYTEGSFCRVYINNSLTSHQSPTGMVDISKGDVLRVNIDTSVAFQNTIIDIKIFNGLNELIDEVVSEKNTNQSISYTIK